MKFTSGAIASIDIGRYTSYGYDQRVEVCELVIIQLTIIICLIFVIKNNFMQKFKWKI